MQPACIIEINWKAAAQFIYLCFMEWIKLLSLENLDGSCLSEKSYKVLDFLLAYPFFRFSVFKKFPVVFSILITVWHFTRSIAFDKECLLWCMQLRNCLELSLLRIPPEWFLSIDHLKDHELHAVLRYHFSFIHAS